MPSDTAKLPEQALKVSGETRAELPSDDSFAAGLRGFGYLLESRIHGGAPGLQIGWEGRGERRGKQTRRWVVPLRTHPALRWTQAAIVHSSKFMFFHRLTAGTPDQLGREPLALLSFIVLPAIPGFPLNVRELSYGRKTTETKR